MFWHAFSRRDVIGQLFGCQRQQTDRACACCRKTQALLLPPAPFIRVCTYTAYVQVCVQVQTRGERRVCVSGGCAAGRWLSHLFRLPLRVLPNTRNVIWRCCSDPFSRSEGETLSVSPWRSTVLVQWHTPTVTEESLYSKDTRLPAPNKAPPN